ncbi:MAG: hypothetical protein KDK91_13015 [Gammaproteobacteria bacterium]|nr:hypothetical protein [Gammaproteobacteria bacterium]
MSWTERMGLVGRRRRRAWRHVLWSLSLAWLLNGCSIDAMRDDLSVNSAALVDDAEYVWLTTLRGEQRSRFSTEDEYVVLSVSFAQNFIGTYLWYRVDWYAPGGELYASGPLRSQFGSHTELIARLPVRGTRVTRYPGEWTVKLFQRDRELFSDQFELVEERAPEEQQLELASDLFAVRRADAAPIEGGIADREPPMPGRELLARAEASGGEVASGSDTGRVGERLAGGDSGQDLAAGSDVGGADRSAGERAEPPAASALSESTPSESTPSESTLVAGTMDGGSSAMPARSSAPSGPDADTGTAFVSADGRSLSVPSAALVPPLSNESRSNLNLSPAAIERAQAFSERRRLLLGTIDGRFTTTGSASLSDGRAEANTSSIADSGATGDSGATAHSGGGAAGNDCPPIWYGPGDCVDRMAQE